MDKQILTDIVLRAMQAKVGSDTYGVSHALNINTDRAAKAADEIQAASQDSAGGEKTFHGAECPSYPNCTGGCGLGCSHEIERSRGVAQEVKDSIETVAVPRWWIKHNQDQMLKMKLPSGPVGDYIFIFREQLGDLLDKGSEVPSASRGTEA